MGRLSDMEQSNVARRESEKDYLNFGEVSQLAVDILNSPGMLPVSVGIFGNWGEANFPSKAD